VWSGTALQVLGRFLGALCTLGILWLAADALEPAGFGRFTFYLALFAWLDALAVLGTGAVAVQRTAGRPERVGPVLKAARRIRVRAASVGVVLVAIAVGVAREPDGGWILLAALYPISHAWELSVTPFRNRIAWSVPVAIRSGTSLLQLALVTVLWRSGGASPATYLVAIALASTTGNLVVHLVSRPHLPPPDPTLEPERGMLRKALPLGLGAILAQTYFYVDNVFIRVHIGDEALGHYNVAVRLMSWSIMLALFVTATALPWLTQRHLAGGLGAAIGQVGPPLFALAGVGCGLFLPWTTELLELFRPGFGAAGPSLRWLLGAGLAVYAGASFATAVVASGDMVSMLWVSAGGVLLNTLGNAVAVPAMGIEGAGLVTFLTELFVAVAAAVVLVRKGLGVGGAWRWLPGILLFAASAWLSSLLPLG
jgi:O-antigen/teichoic acid export membrane protein